MIRIANAPCSWGVIEGVEGDTSGYRRVIDEIGYDGWIVVEEDILHGMGNRRESARRNREYLRPIGV